MQANSDNLLSIIIPVYNRPTLFQRLLLSLPSDPSCQITIINDGSTDSQVQELCEKFLSNTLSNVLVLNNEINRGRAFSLWRGINCSSGQYALIMDSDDYFIASTLNSLIKLLKINSQLLTSRINSFIFTVTSNISLYKSLPDQDSYLTNFTHFRVHDIPFGDLKEVFSLDLAKKVCERKLFTSYRRVPTRFIFDSISSRSIAMYLSQPLIYKQYCSDGITNSLKSNFFARDMWPMFRLFLVLASSSSYKSFSYRIFSIVKLTMYFVLSIVECSSLKISK